MDTLSEITEDEQRTIDLAKIYGYDLYECAEHGIYSIPKGSEDATCGFCGIHGIEYLD